MPRLVSRRAHLRCVGLLAFVAMVPAFLAWQASPQVSPPAASATGRVHGRLLVNGEPKRGFRVMLEHAPWIGIPPKTLTGTDGSFDFGSVATGKMRLRFDLPDNSASFTGSDFFDLEADGDRNVDIARDAGFVSGKLTGALGNTETLVVHVLCNMKSDLGDMGRLHLWMGGRHSTADSNGNFSIGPLVTGSYTIDVERHVEKFRNGRTYLGEYVSEKTTPVVVTKGATTTLESIELVPEVEVSGRFELPSDARLSALILHRGVWFARSYGASRTGDTARLAPDHSFTLHLVPSTYQLGSLGVDDDPHAEADALVVPREGLSNVVITLRKSGQ